ncbi:inactive anthranilate O-methyltransferase 1-like [Musa acuminata AAA Group]|uniref:inactive anthranilate O-methyltransferase 1-like n=1 Tax=Musa acuminata AAA Group TaxID=214697 RepID=UPI0031DF4BF3
MVDFGVMIQEVDHHKLDDLLGFFDVVKRGALTPDSNALKQENITSPSEKPKSGRDHFRIRQDSLSHKLNALKLRREGKIDESEAELELAKALEKQLEDFDQANDKLSYLYGLLAEALNIMVSQGIISEDKVDTFNLPIYGASMQEVKSVIEEEGSFDVQKAESFESSWDPFDDSDNVLNGRNVASTLQAVMEPLISHHFGDAIPHALFSLVADNITARHLLKDKCNYTVLVFTLRRKA